MTRRRMRSSTVMLSATFLALPLALTACEDQDEYTLYCGDEERYVVEAENCERDDDDDDNYFIYYGVWASNYRPGLQLAPNGFKGRVSATNATARGNLNIPPRGGFGGNGAKVSTGSSVGG